MTLPHLVQRWPLDAAEAFAERLAIMVVDGGIPEDRARRLAEERVREEWGRKGPSASQAGRSRAGEGEGRARLRHALETKRGARMT